MTTLQVTQGVATAPPVTERRQELRHNTLGLFDTTVIATSSVAPAYTLAASVAFVVAAVGLQAPAAIVISFLPVLFIAVSYYYLNRLDPNCGASYSWVSRTLSPYVGWLSGWVQLAANVLFCAAAPALAGAYTLQLLNSIFPGQISSSVASNKYLIAVIGIAWLALTTFMVVRGIRVTADFQWALVAIEIIIILGFAAYAIFRALTGSATTQNHFSADWFNPSTPGISALAAGLALGVFFFWGWDTAANVNEETRDADEAPGKAGIYSMFILLGTFLLVSVAIQMTVGLNDISANQNTVLFFFASQLVSSPITYLMILAVLSSTVAVVQTTLLPSSRLSFSMARDGVFPTVFGRIHHRWHTPWAGTLITAMLSVAVIVLALLIDNVNNVFANLILDIGVLVAAYYGITGIACAWAFRRMLFMSLRMFLFAGVLPLVSGLVLFAIAGYVVYSNVSASIPVLVTMGLGLPLLVLAVITNRNGFFRRKTESYIELRGTAQPVSTR